MMLWKWCSQYASKYGKLSSGHRTGKGQFSPNPKERQCQKCSEYHNIALISHTSKVMLKILQARLQQYMNMNFQMFKLVLKKAEEPEIKLPTSDGSSKKQRVPEKHLFLLYWLCQSLWVCGSQQTGKFWKRWDYQTTWLPLEKPVCRSRSNS